MLSCTCSSEMTAKCIREEHIHILKSLSLSKSLQGQKTAVTIRKIQTGFSTSPGLLRFRLEMAVSWISCSVVSNPTAPLLSCHSTGALQSWGEEHCFRIFSWVFLSLGAAALGYTKRANIWTNSHKRRSLNTLTWKGLFLWIDLFKYSRQSLEVTQIFLCK